MKRLGSSGFLSKASEEVVAETKQQLDEKKVLSNSKFPVFSLFIKILWFYQAPFVSFTYSLVRS